MKLYCSQRSDHHEPLHFLLTSFLLIYSAPQLAAEQWVPVEYSVLKHCNRVRDVMHIKDYSCWQLISGDMIDKAIIDQYLRRITQAIRARGRDAVV